MSKPIGSDLAFLVTASPFQSRAARHELDFVLSAMAMDRVVSVFFIGASILQLAEGHKQEGTGLGAGYRGWSVLDDFGEGELYAEKAWVAYCRTHEINLLAEVTPLGRREMNAAWRGSRTALVL